MALTAAQKKTGLVVLYLAVWEGVITDDQADALIQRVQNNNITPAQRTQILDFIATRARPAVQRMIDSAARFDAALTSLEGAI
jgi:hypothetical protein